MATFDAQKTSWTLDDVLHFGRRAGFGLKPEAAAALAAASPGAVIDAWVNGSTNATAFEAAAAWGDVQDEPGYGSQPDLWAPHHFHLRVEDEARLGSAQAYWAWRMQYSPNPFVEKLALFWHNLFATGAAKVDNLALSLKQIQLFRTMGRGAFPDLLVAASQDPAMLIWLDGIQNKLEQPADIPNENYAREAMELYSLGVDNGYSQQDITALARALTGWTFIGRDFPDPENPYYFNDGEFLIMRGQANPYPGHPWLGNDPVVPNLRATGTVTFLGQAFDLGAGSRYGEDLLRAIPQLRADQCATFLAKRLLLAFLGADLPSSALQDFKQVLLQNQFQIGASLKVLFRSAYFFAPEHRWALVEGPTAWAVRSARALMPDFAPAAAEKDGPGGLPRFSAWSAYVNWDTSGFFDLGQSVLNPKGPNGWKEHAAWINSDTYRHRTRFATALGLKEGRGEDHLGVERFLFDSHLADWFPTPPASATAAFDRLTALLQPTPIPAAIRDAWISRLWTQPFVWDGSEETERRIRRLAFLILCAPQAQVH
jgi:uncharacterized protein (DUF1800 family)